MAARGLNVRFGKAVNRSFTKERAARFKQFLIDHPPRKN